jgi:hypothetical protein
LHFLKIDYPGFSRLPAQLHLSFGTRNIVAAALNDHSSLAGDLAARHCHLERHLEIFGNTFQIALVGRAEQPHQQEECHHRRDEIGIGNFPRAAVCHARHFLDALYNNGFFVFIFGHVVSSK